MTNELCEKIVMGFAAVIGICQKGKQLVTWAVQNWAQASITIFVGTWDMTCKSGTFPIKQGHMVTLYKTPLYNFAVLKIVY